MDRTYSYFVRRRGPQPPSEHLCSPPGWSVFRLRYQAHALWRCGCGQLWRFRRYENETWADGGPIWQREPEDA